jgi:diketogulonate reductase-like aldo/keto reductase
MDYFFRQLSFFRFTILSSSFFTLFFLKIVRRPRFFVLLPLISIVYINSQMQSNKDQPTVRLMNAAHGEVLMPVVGLGTGGYGEPDGSGGEYWGNEQGHNATVAWLKMGGRRIDTSNDYASRDGVGTGWIASGVPRSQIFITSKVDPSGYDQALEEFAGILKSIQTDYIDLLLIHWPGKMPCKSDESIPPGKKEQLTSSECRIQTWQALETLFKQEQVRPVSCLSR